MGSTFGQFGFALVGIVFGICVPVEGMLLDAVRAQEVEEATVTVEQEPAQSVSAMFDLGQAQVERGELTEALATFEQVLAQLQAGGERKGEEALVLVEIGKIYRDLARPQEAVVVFQQSAELQEKLENYVQMRNLLREIALLQRSELKQNDLAGAAFKQALETFNQENEELGEEEKAELQEMYRMELLLEWGLEYLRIGETLHGFELVKQGRQVRKSLEENLPESFSSLEDADFFYSIAANDVGIHFFQQGKYEESIPYFEEVFNILEPLNNSVLDKNTKAERLAFAKANISTAYSNMNRLEDAIKAGIESRKILGEYPDFGYAVVSAQGLMRNYISLASQQSESHDYSRALDSLEEAYSLAQETQNRENEVLVLNSISDVHRAAQDFNAAIPFLEKAIELSNLDEKPYAVSTNLILARTYLEIDKYPKALDIFSEVLDYQSSIGNALGAARTGLEMAVIYSQQGEYKRAYEAEKSFLEVVRKSQQLYEHQIDASNFKDACKSPEKFSIGFEEDSLSFFCEKLNSKEKITPFHLNLLSESRDSYLEGLLEGEASAMNSIALSLSYLGKAQEGIPYMEQAIVISKKIDDLTSVGLYTKNLGNIYSALGNIEKSSLQFEAAAAIAESIRDDALLQSSYENTSLRYSAQGQHQRAIEFALKAFELSQSSEVPSDKSSSLHTLSLVYNNAGEYEKAVESAKQSLDLIRSLGIKTQEQSTVSTLAWIYQEAGEWKKAAQLNEEALRLAAEIDGPIKLADAKFSLASFESDRSAYSGALSTYNEALNLYQKTGLRELEAITLSRIAGVESQLGQYDIATSKYREALAIAQDIGAAKRVSTIQRRIADNFVQQQRYDQALKVYQDGLSTARSRQQLLDIMANLTGLGRVYRNDTKLKKAENAFAEALELAKTTGRRIEQAELLSELGRTQVRQGKRVEAEQTFNQALILAREVRDPQREAEILSDLGELYAEQSPEIAITFYKQSVNTYETIRGGLNALNPETQQSYTNTVAETYRALADLLLQQDRPIEALQILDLLKVQELQDFLKDAKGKEIAIGLLPQEKNIFQAIEDLPSNQSLSSLLASPAIQQQVQNLQETAAANNLKLPAYDDLQHRLQALSSDAALLYPLILEDRIELVVLTPDRPPVHQPVSISRTELQTKIQTFSQAISNPSSNIKPIAQELYQLLIKPIEAELQAAGIETLIYAPDGQMRYVPLAALHSGNGEHDGQWLAERYQLNYLTALALTPLTPQSTDKPKVLAGAVTESHSVSIFETLYRFAGLKFTLPEIQSLAQVFGATQLIDDEFSRDQLQRLMPSHNMFHLATHAKFIPGNPEESFILMGDGETISLREIDAWELPNVELMVLSACETALGERLGNGLEILGFGYQMQRTGARASLASLWAIDDGGTQIFMNSFYGALEQGMSTAEAVQAAQQALIAEDAATVKAALERGLGPKNQRSSLPTASKLSHPYYWAPFILIGNGL